MEVVLGTLEVTKVQHFFGVTSQAAGQASVDYCTIVEPLEE